MIPITVKRLIELLSQEDPNDEIRIRETDFTLHDMMPRLSHTIKTNGKRIVTIECENQLDS